MSIITVTNTIPKTLRLFSSKVFGVEARETSGESMSTCCSGREPELSPQHPHQEAHNRLISSSQGADIVGLLQHPHSHGQTHVHIFLIKYSASVLEFINCLMFHFLILNYFFFSFCFS